MAKFPIFLTGGEIPLKFDQPLKLEQIPTKNKIHVINNYSPNYDYIVEGDKIYYAKKGNNYWVDISDNDVARKNLYNFLGTKYDFRGYEDDEKNIWNLIQQGTFNYQLYRESKNKPAVRQKPKARLSSSNLLVSVRVPTAGGGFTNIKAPAYMVDLTIPLLSKPKAEYYGQVMDIARKEQSYRYADPINNASNWLPFIILTGGRGLENMGVELISPLVNKGMAALRPLAGLLGNIGKTAITKAGQSLSRIPQYYVQSSPKARAALKALGATGVITEAAKFTAPKLKGVVGGDMGEVLNSFLDGNFVQGSTLLYNGGKRQIEKKFGSELSDVPSTLNLTELLDTNSEYAIRPLSFYGDTVRVSDRQYIIPEGIDVNQFTFGARNRGDMTPIQSEAAPITAFTAFKPFGLHNTNYLTYIGIDLNGNLKVGDISLFGTGDVLTGTYSNDIVSFKKDTKGNLVYKRDTAHNNGSRSVPIVLTKDGKEGSLNILTDKNQQGNTYGNISGGRVLVRTGDELRLLSGSIDDIEEMFEDMKKRNRVNYGTFYTLDNGSFNRGLRTFDRQFTRLDLARYDLLNVGTSGNFLYIKSEKKPKLKFSSDTILTPNIRTVNSESYKAGYPLQNELKGVVLHHTAFMEDDLTNVLNHLTNPQTEASAHVVIGYDGSRKVLATPDKVTFHAGYSAHNGRENVNDFMIGIEFQGDTNKKDLTPQQIESAVEYLEPIIRRNGIRLEDIVTHLNVRDLYNDYAARQGKKPADKKVDINEKNYNLILQALLRKVYYKK